MSEECLFVASSIDALNFDARVTFVTGFVTCFNQARSTQRA